MTTGDDLRRRYQSGVSNAPDTTGVFTGTVTRVISQDDLYVRVPRLTGVFENKARSVVADIQVGDQVFVSLLEGRRDDFVVIGKSTPGSSLPTGEPTGFANRPDSVVSFVDATRTFTIAPESTVDHFDVWVGGVKFPKFSAESVVIPNTSGTHYIYYNTAGVLTAKTTFFDLSVDAPVSYIYWNATDSAQYFFADERHGFTMDWATHEYLHRTRGTAYSSGLALNNYTISASGNLETSARVGMDDGTIFDEDIPIEITNSASPVPNTWEQRISTVGYFPVFYLVGSAWKKDVAVGYPLKFTTLATYNLNTAGTWSAQAILNNRFCIYWLVATNNLSEPVLSIMGQAEYSNVGQAEAATWSEMSLTGLPIYEFRLLYKLVFQTSSGYTNSVKSRLVSVADMRTASSGTAGAPVAVGDHGSLTGLVDDDHTQYLRTDGTRAFTGSLVGDITTVGAITSGTTLASGTTVTAGTGITATTGNIAASAGAVSASTTVTAGTGLVLTSGIANLPFGTAAAPTLTFVGAITNGISWSATNGLQVSTAGTLRARWGTTGHYIPGADATSDIGESATRWKDAYLSGNVTLGGATSQIAIGAATAGTSSLISFTGFGVAAPTFTTRSAGTKIVLYPALTGVRGDYAIGIDGATLWSSVPDSASAFKWYAGTTVVATLTGAGALTATGAVSATSFNSTATSAFSVNGASGDALRLVGTSPYMGIHNTGAAARTGYLQGNHGSDLRLVADAATPTLTLAGDTVSIRDAAATTTRVTINSTGLTVNSGNLGTGSGNLTNGYNTNAAGGGAGSIYGRWYVYKTLTFDGTSASVDWSTMQWVIYASSSGSANDVAGISLHVPSAGVAPIMRCIGTSGTVDFVNAANTAYISVRALSFTVMSSIKFKKNAVEMDDTVLLEKMASVKTHRYENKVGPITMKRTKAYEKRVKDATDLGLPEPAAEAGDYTYPAHNCAKDGCDGTAASPCPVSLNNSPVFGLIAEDVYSSIPEVANLGADRTPESIDINQVATMAFGGVGALLRRIKILEDRLTAAGVV